MFEMWFFPSVRVHFAVWQMQQVLSMESPSSRISLPRGSSMWQLFQAHRSLEWGLDTSERLMLTETKSMKRIDPNRT
jgi:hypothetical protein